MKTKDQKRREAIERLERAPYLGDMEPGSWGYIKELEKHEKRMTEATRLREKFGLISARGGES